MFFLEPSNNIPPEPKNELDQLSCFGIRDTADTIILSNISLGSANIQIPEMTTEN